MPVPKSQVRAVDDHGLCYEVLAFVCPGCALDGSTGLHLLPVNSTTKKPSWTWDGNYEAPTLSPSILSNGHGQGRRCHSFLTAGVFQFLDDSEHALAGQSVPIPDLPDWFCREGA